MDTFILVKQQQFGQTYINGTFSSMDGAINAMLENIAETIRNRSETIKEHFTESVWEWHVEQWQTKDFFGIESSSRIEDKLFSAKELTDLLKERYQDLTYENASN